MFPAFLYLATITEYAFNLSLYLLLLMWVNKNKKKILRAVEKFGTPLYIYSEENLLKQIAEYKKAFRGIDVLFCYALKANSNRHLCSLIAGRGFGADVVSGGELRAALSSGFRPEKIIFSGVGKTEEELALALRKNIFFINVESFEELEKLDETASRLGKRADFSIRINPDVDPHTHNYIATGKSGSKFGVDFEEASRMYSWARKRVRLNAVSAHFHLGSQLFSPVPYRKAFKKLLKFVSSLEKSGINLKSLDIGGGWGVKEGLDMGSPAVIAEIIRPYAGKYSFIMEPGRSVTASSGILAARALYRKTSGKRNIVILDAAMNDFIRPSLYGASHPVLNLSGGKGKKVRADIAGPVCESGDFFLKDFKTVLPERGDVLVILSAGAYGYSMSSNYNLRPKPAEVLLKKSGVRLIRKRQSYPEII